MVIEDIVSMKKGAKSSIPAQYVQSNDISFLCDEALKYHQLSLQMYMDILGQHPMNASYARCLLNRGKTFLMLSDLDEAENDLKQSLDIFSSLSERAMIMKEQVGYTATALSKLCCRKDNDFQRFIKYLNISMKAFSELSTYEMNLFKDRTSKRKSIGVPICSTELTDTQLTQLSPHPLLCDVLVQAAQILQKNSVPDLKVNVLYAAALKKYKQIYGRFEHPKIVRLKEKLQRKG